MSINMTGEPHVHNYGKNGCYCGAQQCVHRSEKPPYHRCLKEALKGERHCQEHLEEYFAFEDY
jgi:hypothetical protein